MAYDDEEKLRAEVIRKFKMKKATQKGEAGLEEFKQAFPRKKEPIKKAEGGMVKALPTVLTSVSEMMAKKAKNGMKKKY